MFCNHYCILQIGLSLISRKTLIKENLVIQLQCSFYM
uniref:Uncharacterized protein n=1 Tax=Heterorhabditis bacteriophora TaxID=37862 RepID=A0A1I7XEM3_HETBA